MLRRPIGRRGVAAFAFPSIFLTIANFTGVAIAKPLRTTPISFPSYDISATCRSLPDTAQCVYAEQQARSRLSQLWAQLSDEKRARCDSIGRSQGNSYVAASACAER
jgi:hypothetical protein